ncbi:1,2-phenylacetyl-CoA epoxidase subunit PaaC [Flavobacterium branchiophilum]|uniref:Phenylacetic acid degradation protein PaaC n=1 Tax=Flavobacterium branchiophilum (strain FL-15) TaxID=1034807 RepID=G2Z117_FLABF|nr:1,2-phenylacetyl-CoA epoxidase subunit PaaC [Flavobacterium branchiophilum]CCB69573.1 Phenylacetic acid degradation protein PaaC [Flavobacterium branchiophilum FL-15]
MKKDLIAYLLGIADNSLILGQRLGELCGHGPSLETDIALTNIALDLFGQTRSYYQYAASLSDQNTNEDQLAFLRQETAYQNVLLVEQPNIDFAYTITRQFLFDIFHQLLLENLQYSKDQQLVAIAQKSLKEVKYHVLFSSEWVLRLGNGTQESHIRMQKAINDLWVYTDELFDTTAADSQMIAAGIGIDGNVFKSTYYDQIKAILIEATLEIPNIDYFLKGGKKGIHSEHFGYILTEMQYLQRSYPNMNW